MVWYIQPPLLGSLEVKLLQEDVSQFWRCCCLSRWCWLEQPGAACRVRENEGGKKFQHAAGGRSKVCQSSPSRGVESRARTFQRRLSRLFQEKKERHKFMTTPFPAPYHFHRGKRILESFGTSTSSTLHNVGFGASLPLRSLAAAALSPDKSSPLSPSSTFPGHGEKVMKNVSHTQKWGLRAPLRVL